MTKDELNKVIEEAKGEFLEKITNARKEFALTNSKFHVGDVIKDTRAHLVGIVEKVGWYNDIESKMPERKYYCRHIIPSTGQTTNVKPYVWVYEKDAIKYYFKKKVNLKALYGNFS